MAEVKVEDIKELREKTGISLNECKKALIEANGNQEEAINILRKKGLSAGAKKSDREAKDGVILTGEDNSAIVMVECNAETDFVATNDRFLDFVRDVVAQALKSKPATLEELLNLHSGKEKGMTLEQCRNLAVQALGENIQVRRFQIIPKKANKSYGIYTHSNGKLVVVAELDGATGKEALAKEVALHAAALNPLYLNPESIPENVKKNEEEIARSMVDASKPANVVEKIVQGKIAKFYSENCLILQPFVKDGTKTVEQHVKAGGANTVSAFYLMKVGQA